MASPKNRGKLGALFQSRQYEGVVFIDKTAAAELYYEIFGSDLLSELDLTSLIPDQLSYAEFERLFLALDGQLEAEDPVKKSEIFSRNKFPEVEESSAGVEETLEAVLAEQRNMNITITDLLNRVSCLEALAHK